MRAFYAEKRRLEGITEEARHQLTLVDQQALRSAVDKLFLAKDTGTTPRFTPDETLAIAPYRNWLGRTSAEARSVPGTVVGNDPNHIMHMPRREDITEYSKDSNAYLARVLPEYLRYNEQYLRSRGEDWNQGVAEEAKEHLKGRMARILHARSSSGSASEFNAIREEKQKFGLPPSMRENDVFKLMERYGARFAADLSKIKNIENDPPAAHYFGLSDNNSLPASSTAIIALQHINGTRANDANPKYEVLDAVQRFVSSLIMQAKTGTVNLVENVRTIAPDIVSLERFGHFVTGVRNTMSDWNRVKSIARQSGTLKKDTTDYEWGNDEVMRYRISRALNDASKDMAKGSTLNALETVSRVFTASVGEQMGKHALANHATDPDARAFLEKYGAGIQGLNPHDQLVTIVGNYVTAKQSSYTAEGLSDTMARRGTTSQLFRLKRYGIEQTARAYNDVIVPLKNGDTRPLIAYLLASFGFVKEAKDFIDRFLGKPDYKPTEQELAQFDDQELERVLNFMESVDQSGGLLIIGDLMGTMARNVRGQEFSEVQSPLVSLGVDLIKAATDTAEAVQKGEPFDWAFRANMDRLAKRYVQNYKLLTDVFDNQGANERRDKAVYSGLKKGRKIGDALKALKPFGGQSNGRNPGLHTLVEKYQSGTLAEAERAAELIKQADEERNLKALIDNYPGTFEGKKQRRQFEEFLLQAWGPEKVEALKSQQREFENRVRERLQSVPIE